MRHYTKDGIMPNKLKLLPHWCQIAGYTYLTLFITACISAIILTGISPESNGFVSGAYGVHRFLLDNWSIVGSINFIMMLMAVFSRETVEDEMTRAIRLRALVYLVIFLFIIHILLFIPDYTIAWKVINDTRNLFMNDFGVPVITYAFLYKFMIGINKWRMLHEE